jgi:hypothetical protein
MAANATSRTGFNAAGTLRIQTSSCPGVAPPASASASASSSPPTMPGSDGPGPGTRERGLASGGDHVSRGPCEVEPSNNDDDDDDDDGSGDPAVVVVVFVFIFVVVVVGGAFVEVPVSASPGRFVVFVVG